MGKVRHIAIEQAKALATQWEAQYEEHLRTAAIASRFKDATPSQVIHMWETCRNERGQRLSRSEVTALVERWLELFGAYPPGDTEPGDTAQPTEPEPQDDDILSPRDVVRLTGLSLSTIKRMVNDGRFHKPMHLSPRRIGWPAREVKGWLKRLDDQRRATR
jgi:predicted DNA-binding transcriptional regulator AlpA